MPEMLEKLVSDSLSYCETASFREAVWRQCPHLPQKVGIERFSTRIHPADQMLLHSLRHHGDVATSCSQYYSVGLQQYSAFRQILSLNFPGQENEVRILDFACGFGRLLRFLSLDVPHENLWASEIQEDALDFVRQNFGTQIIASGPSPDDFQPQQGFHIIWVASLFSHLNPELFTRWLKRLTDCLEPGGILCFSTHGDSLLPSSTPMPESGVLFFPSSENPDLPSSQYGTTYVTEAYVRSTLQQHCPDTSPSFVLPRGLAHEQDIHIVARGKRDLSALQGFRRGPWGWADIRQRTADGTLHLQGWAASIDDGPLESIDILVNGQHFSRPADESRPKVAAALDDPRLEHCGWSLELPLPPDQPAVVEISASRQAGESMLLFAGTLPPTKHIPASPAPAGLLRRLFGRFGNRPRPD